MLVINNFTLPCRSEVKIDSIAIKINHMLESGDPSEIGYVSTRCGCLFSLLANYLEQGNLNNDKKMFDTIKKLRDESLVFWYVSEVYEIQINRMTRDDLNKRRESINNFYAKFMNEGKIINNNAITDFISDEIKLAKKTKPYFDEIKARLSNRK